MAPDDSDPRDPKVGELLAGRPLGDAIDAATRKELERWFGLPSFAEREEQSKAVETKVDPEIQAVLDQRAAAIAAVDPQLVAAIRARTEDRQAHLLQFTADLDVHVDPDLALFTPRLVDRAMLIAEPRQVQRPDDIDDDLKDRVPQALLRDLHRPESYYDKVFELVDMAAAQRFDIVAEVASAMRASWRLPALGPSPFGEADALLASARRVRRESWVALWTAKPLPNRSVV
jgi:hypothetical protein